MESQVVWKQVNSISELKEGDRVKHVNNDVLGGIVQANYEDYAIAVDIYHISNPPEWLVLRKE
jgi:hypothetical protein